MAAEGVPAYVTPIRTVYSTPKGGWVFWLLGLVITGAILYYFFVYAPSAYTSQDILLIALGAVFLGGFIARKGTRGALLGFIVFFVPLMALGIIVMMGVVGAAGSAQGLETLGPVIGAAAGIMLMALAVAAGVIGLVVAGIAGWISGKVFPIGGRP